MKKQLIPVFITLFLLLGCSSSQQITSTWVKEDSAGKGPFESIFVAALIPNETQRAAVEDKMAEALKKRGHKVETSTNLFPKGQAMTKDERIKMIKDSGCDGILTISILDVKTESRYIKGSDPAYLPPYRFRFYDSYSSYYSYRNAQISTPGYVEKQTTYFFETNFYDTASENLLWSIQSSAFQPSNIENWFDGYKPVIIKELKKEGLLKM